MPATIEQPSDFPDEDTPQGGPYVTGPDRCVDCAGTGYAHNEFDRGDCVWCHGTGRRVQRGVVPPDHEQIAALRTLVADLIDPDECTHFDHHGYCQTHGWFETDPPCPHTRARALGIDPS